MNRNDVVLLSLLVEANDGLDQLNSPKRVTIGTVISDVINLIAQGVVTLAEILLLLGKLVL